MLSLGLTCVFCKRWRRMLFLRSFSKPDLLRGSFLFGFALFFLICSKSFWRYCPNTFSLLTHKIQLNLKAQWLYCVTVVRVSEISMLVCLKTNLIKNTVESWVFGKMLTTHEGLVQIPSTQLDLVWENRVENSRRRHINDLWSLHILHIHTCTRTHTHTCPSGHKCRKWMEIGNSEKVQAFLSVFIGCFHKCHLTAMCHPSC